jgi:hypothetical protein
MTNPAILAQNGNGDMKIKTARSKPGGKVVPY